MCLGRFGDIANILPWVLHENQSGNKPIVCVAKEFEGILDGVGYCDRIVWPGLYNESEKAARWLQQEVGGKPIIIAQAYRHPWDRNRNTTSYQTESWRVAGALGEFGKHPLIFDKRDPSLYPDLGKGKILVSLKSVSSPFNGSSVMNALLQSRFADNVMDISDLRVDHIYDLVTIFDRALCLISVDTAHLHLSRAAKVPVIAITNNGYFGSVTPPATICSLRYADADIPQRVCDAVSNLVDAIDGHRFVVQSSVIHACHVHADSERHARAQLTWPKATEGESVIKCLGTDWEHDAREIGDPRSVPSLKSVLKAAKDKAISDNDVVIFHNSDVSLQPGSVKAMREHAAVFGAFSIRRVEPESTYTHIGRELFGFRVGWLNEFLTEIPDFYIGAPAYDLVLSAMIRKQHGIISTMENMAVDFYPCEMPAGLVYHEPHVSSWAGENEFKLQGNLHNLKLAKSWCAANCPSLSI